MGLELVGCLIILVVVGMIAKKMTMNGGFTAGKYLFKMSDTNLEENKGAGLFSVQDDCDNKNILD